MVIASGLWATNETEPNNSSGDTGVTLCENGQHAGEFSPNGDVDFWFFSGFPEDNVTISTLGLTNRDTVIEIYNSEGVLVAINDDYELSTQSQVTYLVPDDDMYYVSIREYFNNVGSYGFTVSGLFYSPYAIPNVPFNYNIPNGATGVDPYTANFTWTWGDGSLIASWEFLLGTSPSTLASIGDSWSPVYVLERAGSIANPSVLIGGITYYYAIQIILGGTQWTTPVYSFTTSQINLPVPFSENFDTPAMMFASQNPTSPWVQLPVEEGNPSAIVSMGSANGTSIMMEKGIHNLAASTAAYLTFRHIGLLEPGQDHAYLEYSPDNGASWTIFPASAYLGSGVYTVPSANNPEGPCFDAGSYANWADYQSISSVTGLWHTESFDLTPWAAYANFRVRLRAVYDNDSIGLGWIVDDLAILLHPTVVPNMPFPAVGSSENNTNLRLSWQAVNAMEYDIAFGTNPASLATYTVSPAYWDALNLSPYTTYYWKVRARNEMGTTDWSALWNFSTQQYNTPWHLNSSLSINWVQFGSISNTSLWNGYTNYSALTTSAQCGVDLPISVHLAGGYGPEAVRVWVDINRDAVFSNNPANGEYWDIPWSGDAFHGIIHLPSQLVASPTRMRIQAIHTNGTDVLAPSGVFQYGETEDYLLLTTDSPILTVTPTWAVFSDTPVGLSSQPIRFTFANTGGQSLNVTLTGITGPNSGSFTLAEGNSYPIQLVSNSASVDIYFSPQNVGNLSAFLNVRDNLTRTDHYYPLSGIGIGVRADGALSFDGSGENVSVPSAAALSSLSRLTIETWFKWDGGAPIQFLTAKNFEELEIHTNGSNNSLRFIPTAGVFLDSQANVLLAGQWQHLACVYDPSTSLGKIYLDGVDVTAQNNGPNPLSTPLQSTSSSFRMGMRQAGDYPFAGSLDELRLWNTARSAEDIRNNMHLLQSTASAGLVANWRLNELSGNYAFDQIQGLHGNLLDMEAADHSTSTVVLGTGTAATLSPSVTGFVYDFPGTGVKLNFSQIAAAGSLTVTRLSSGGSRDVLNGQTWLLRRYDSAVRTADFTCTVAEDIQAGQLPASNFSLMGRLPVAGASWTLLNRASQADINTNTLSFPNISCDNRQTRVEWVLFSAPEVPQNLIISQSGENVELQWSPITGATGYKVFSSGSPDGPFLENLTGVYDANAWHAPLAGERLFFQVRSLRD